MKLTFHHSLLILLAAFSVSCSQTYNGRIEYGDNTVDEFSFQAKNDSLANVYAFQKVVDAMNRFERTEGNKDNVKDIDYKKWPETLHVFKKKDGVEVTNVTPEMKNAAMKGYTPSSTRLAMEKAERERIDSLASFAWGELKFGMSKAEIEALPQFKRLRRKGSFSIGFSDFSYEYAIPDDTNRQIVNDLGLCCNSGLELIFAGADGKELTGVKLELPYNQVSSIDVYNVVVDCKRLISLISAKYGESSLTENHLERLERSVRNKSYSDIYPLAKWVIGHKSISLNVWKLSSSQAIRYSLSIGNDQFPKNTNKAPASVL